ncbi:MAG: site-specific DNA-methyltransferase [Betaproteobacteria bacterium]|nr:site-specific DNA-methyltransferase [Betaproteobacteria bacterium]
MQILRGNALALALADESVDLIVTSPPYFGLRSYQDGGEHYAGQIGDEPTPAEFVDALIAATREMVRVVKPSGSIWVNLGDKYASTQSSAGGYSAKSGLAGFTNANTKGRQMNAMPTRRIDPEVRAKSLIGIPWRYAIRCIDDLGLILRAEVIWSKPNGLPESVTDRVRRSHEQWFHFTREPRYFSAVDEIREAHLAPNRSGTNPKHESAPFAAGIPAHTSLSTTQPNPLGKLPGSVWTIPTEPLHVPESLGIDHFAAFPTEWPRRIIQGWSPRGICVECGEGRRPTSERDPIDPRFLASNKRGDGRGNVEVRGVSQSSILRTGLQAGQSPATRITGEACACPEPTAPTRPAVVLDPFGGTGTTALVAKALGRHGISNDMSSDYCRLAQWRTSDPKQQAKAARREYREPTPQVEGQSPLFDIEMPQKPPPDKFHRTGWQNGPVDRTNYKCSACGKEKQYADATRPCPSCGEAA